ncbi:hypothetical protein EYF80_000219 [Liparis tanakae]|uniref:Uncharacterized protein n=1 Tax=Liparis tanakae TaxID=230148 RepID=A0A4Z2JH42_9TELE|nr:hypothetical protein EYF80_000219 [Liparis tanakae]
MQEGERFPLIEVKLKKKKVAIARAKKKTPKQKRRRGVVIRRCDGLVPPRLFFRLTFRQSRESTLTEYRGRRSSLWCSRPIVISLCSGVRNSAGERCIYDSSRLSGPQRVVGTGRHRGKVLGIRVQDAGT